jgi:hypothetical protein
MDFTLTCKIVRPQDLSLCAFTAAFKTNVMLIHHKQDMQLLQDKQNHVTGKP